MRNSRVRQRAKFEIRSDRDSSIGAHPMRGIRHASGARGAPLHRKFTPSTRLPNAVGIF